MAGPPWGVAASRENNDCPLEPGVAVNDCPLEAGVAVNDCPLEPGVPVRP